MLPIHNIFIEALYKINKQDDFVLREIGSRITALALVILSALASAYLFIDAARKSLSLAALHTVEYIFQKNSTFLEAAKSVLLEKVEPEVILQHFSDELAKQAPGVVFGAIGVVCPKAAVKLSVSCGFYKSQKPIEWEMYVHLIQLALKRVKTVKKQAVEMKKPQKNPYFKRSDCEAFLFDLPNFEEDSLPSRGNIFINSDGTRIAHV